MVSFVVVTYNSADTLKNCLQALERVKDAEIIVVDNASSDNSTSVAEGFKGVKLIRSETNRGFNGGNQLGYNATTSDIVAFLNPDTVVKPDFAVLLERVFADHPAAGVVGCRIENADGSLQRTCNRFPTLGSHLYEHSGYHTIFPNSRAYKKYVYNGWDRLSERYVGAVSGACTAVRRSTLEAIGGLDTNYFLFYEEPDLGKAVQKVGQKVFFTPNITVSHIGATSTKKSDPKFINATYLASRDYYLQKWHGRFAVTVFYALKFVFDKLGGLKLRLAKLK